MELVECALCLCEAKYFCLECNKGFCYEHTEKEHISNKRGYRDLCPDCGEELEKSF